MEYRLPKLSDKEIIMEYVIEHYARGEYKLPATIGLLSMEYEEWVNKINNNAIIPDKLWKISYTYLVFDKEKLIGFLSIRPLIDDELANKYGHIGYAVRPSERRKGYASQMLKYALSLCKEQGLKKVILGCFKENIGSSKTMIKNGGKLIREVIVKEEINEYYTINLVNQFYEIEL